MAKITSNETRRFARGGVVAPPTQETLAAAGNEVVSVLKRMGEENPNSDNPIYDADDNYADADYFATAMSRQDTELGRQVGELVFRQLSPQARQALERAQEAQEVNGPSAAYLANLADALDPGLRANPDRLQKAGSNLEPKGRWGAMETARIVADAAGPMRVNDALDRGEIDEGTFDALSGYEEDPRETLGWEDDETLAIPSGEKPLEPENLGTLDAAKIPLDELEKQIDREFGVEPAEVGGAFTTEPE